MKNDYWFKRRRYGWGYFPVTWQGWTTVASTLAIIIIVSFILPENRSHIPTTKLVIYHLILLIDILASVTIVLKKGPPPKWRWGKKPTDNKEEDF